MLSRFMPKTTEVFIMKEFTQKLTATAEVTVGAQNTAAAVGSGSLDVFATPMMLALMEKATCAACAELLEDSETTVGTSVSITHDKASATGTKITACAELEEVDGRKLVFSVSAQDDKGDTIGKGTVERFVVLSDKFMKRANGK